MKNMFHGHFKSRNRVEIDNVKSTFQKNLNKRPMISTIDQRAPNLLPLCPAEGLNVHVHVRALVLGRAVEDQRGRVGRVRLEIGYFISLLRAVIFSTSFRYAKKIEMIERINEDNSPLVARPASAVRIAARRAAWEKICCLKERGKGLFIYHALSFLWPMREYGDWRES